MRVWGPFRQALPRPGIHHAWTVPAALFVIAGSLIVCTPWGHRVVPEIVRRLPEGYSDDQVVISRVFRHRVLLGLPGPARQWLAARTTTLEDIRPFQGDLAIARLRTGARPADVRRDVVGILGDPTVRVFPIREIVLGDTPLLSAPWAAALAVALVRAVVLTRRRPRWWRYRLYEFVLLLSAGFLLLVVFVITHEATESAGLIADSLFGIAYALLTAVSLWLWRWDVRTRCRVCVAGLRLPMELGEEGSMLLETPRVERVCIQGHGALTMDRWQDDWRGYRSMWEAFSQRTNST